jgi:hypothetical protein
MGEEGAFLKKGTLFPIPPSPFKNFRGGAGDNI